MDSLTMACTMAASSSVAKVTKPYLCEAERVAAKSMINRATKYKTTPN